MAEPIEAQVPAQAAQPEENPESVQAVQPDVPESGQAAGEPEDLRASNLADLERENRDPGLFAAGSQAPPADGDDPFDLRSKGLTIGDLLVAEQPGPDRDEVLSINPKFVTMAKAGVVAPTEAPRPGQQPDRDATPLHGVTVWLDSGRVYTLVHRWADPRRAERFVAELRKVW